MRIRDRLFLAILLPLVKLTQRLESWFEANLKRSAPHDPSVVKALKALLGGAGENLKLIVDAGERKLVARGMVPILAAGAKQQGYYRGWKESANAEPFASAEGTGLTLKLLQRKLTPKFFQKLLKTLFLTKGLFQ